MEEVEVADFPLFPAEMVALPSEIVPLHIIEERHIRMIEHCLGEEKEFGIVWLSDDGLRPVGCACEIAQILERFADGRLHLLARGTRPFELIERKDGFSYPAGTIRFIADRDEVADEEIRQQAYSAYQRLLEKATDQKVEPEQVDQLTAYEIAATVNLNLDAKQGLLDLRSETARLKLVTRLVRAAAKAIDFSHQIEVRAKSNGRVSPN